MGYRKVDVNPFNSILSILFLVAVFIGLYYVATGIFTILSWLAPVMLIGALVVNHNVVINYGKWLINTLKSNFLLGVGALLLTIFGYPIIAGYLFAKALVSRKLEKVQEDFRQRTQPQYADFEEVDTEDAPYEDLTEKPLDLNAPRPVQSPPKQKDSSGGGSEYDRLFE